MTSDRAPKLLLCWLALVLLGGSVSTIRAIPAAAAGETLEVVLGQLDGTAPFDVASGPGKDVAEDDGVVRTNDNLTYQVEVSVTDANATDVIFTLALPQGVELDAIPPYCVAGSALTPATLPPPPVPTSSTSWTTLSTQTLDCVVGDRSAFSTFTYPVVARVRPEVPNGTLLDPVVASAVSADVTTPAVSNEVLATVSARAQFDLSKNSISETENRGYFSTSGLRTCADGSGRTCQQYVIPMLISAPAGGRGISPLQGPVTFTDDLTPASLYGAAAVADADYVAAGPDALTRYGAMLVSCRSLNWSQPLPRLSSGDETTAVRESGTTSCTQPGGPGTPVDVSITGMDSTAYTVPTEAARPAGRVLPANRGYVYSWAITVQIPLEAVTDLGIAAADGSRTTLNWDNRYTDFEPLGFDGVVNDPSAQDAFNDHRASSLVATTSGRFDKYFVGVPGTPGNVSPTDFNPGWAIFEGPTGGTGPQTGEGQVFPGERVISMLNFDARNGTTGRDVSYLACDGWDPTLLQLQADEYPASAVARAQALPSNGAPVWISGRAFDSRYATETSPLALPDMTVEYGNAPGGSGMTCDDADSPGGWHTDPADVPGNDPVAMTDGRYTGVSAVRVHLVQPPHTTGVGTWTWVSIGLRSTPGLPVDTIIPNHASSKVVYDNATMAEMLDQSVNWVRSSYVAATNVGARGDRLRAGGAVVRLAKEVRHPGTGDWVTTTPAVTGGQQVEFRLRPTLTAGVDFGVELPVRIEDCLPQGQQYLSANVNPSVVQDGAPVDAELACAAGQTYVRWDLPTQPVNEAITPIEYRVQLSPSAVSGTKTNVALVSSPSDPSAAPVRDAQAAVQVTQPAGIGLSKVALTPVVELNRAGEANPDPLRWRVEMINLDTDPGPSDVDLIDRLPSDGLGASNFGGSLAFVSATVTSGGPAAEVLYTAADAANIELDALDPSNDALTGTTVWCDAPTSGSVVLGAGTAVDCPTAAADVTGLRVVRPGAFGPGDEVEFEVEMLPTANAAGDVYDNVTAARATGLFLPVGPVNASAVVVDGSIGDRVWRDDDGDGLQDLAEPGIDGLTVGLDGIDTDGNAVSMTTTTAGGGTYRFDGLPSGDYDISFSLPAPAGAITPVFTLQDQGLSEAVDSDGDGATGVAAVSLGAGTDRDDVDQGVLYPVPSVTIVKSIDGDDANTSPGVAVEVGDTMDVTFAITNDGNVNLADVVLTDSHLTAASISCPTTALARGETTTCTATTATPAAGVVHMNTATVVATPAALPDGTLLADVSADDVAYATSTWASISGSVYADANNDGTRDLDEDGIGGVALGLAGTDAFGQPVVAFTTTDDDGNWSFDGLAAGTYRVTETQPPSHLDGAERVGSGGGDASTDDIFDAVTVTTGGRLVGYDYGELLPAMVSGMVLDEFGAPISGIEIVLEGADDTGPIVAQTTITGADGAWSFGDLRPGTYAVIETQPAGYGDGVDVAGTGGSTSTVDDRFDVTLSAGASSTDNLFTEEYGSVSGTVFHDLDADGVRDLGEPGIDAVSVALSGVDLDGRPVNLMVETSTDGSYRFDGLLAGDYDIEEVQPVAYLDGIDTVGDLGGDGSVDDRVTGIAVAAGADGVDYDFAELGTVLSGVVWLDPDTDGVIEVDETGRLAGVEITLRDANGDIIAVTETDDEGRYQFTSLVAGDYTVEQTHPLGHASTTPNQLDVTVPTGGLADVDFGEDLGSITGVVWADDDGGGTHDDTDPEPRRGGIVVRLLDTDGVVIATTSTADDGTYSFDDLLAGTYRVEVVPPAGSALTVPDQGDDERVDSDTDWVTAISGPIELVPGPCGSSAGDDCERLGTVADIDAGLIIDDVDLAISKRLQSSGVVYAGDEISWEIVVTNRGTTPAGPVVVEDDLPAGLTYVAVDGAWSCVADGGVVTCTADEPLLVGAASSFTIVTTVSGPPTSLVNRAVVSTDNDVRIEQTPDDNSDDAVITITSRPGTLPFTGGGLRLVIPALALLLTGAGLWWGSDRRQRGTAPEA